MAEATRYANVIVSSTSGDSITGPLMIVGIKSTQGTGTNIISFKNGAGTVIWSNVMAANTSSQMDTYAGKGWEVRSGDTYSVTQSGSNGTLYIYLG